MEMQDTAGDPGVIWTTESEPGQYINFPERYAARLTAACAKIKKL